MIKADQVPRERYREMEGGAYKPVTRGHPHKSNNQISTTNTKRIRKSTTKMNEAGI